jgi:two-component system chemotaxis response regulator CheY
MNDRPSPKILIADDAADSRQLLASLMRRLSPAEIVEARDGQAALERFAALRPRLTFLDIDMPLRSGMQVLQTIRQTDPHAFVVIVSGFGALEHVQAALALRVSGFVVKPYSPQRIVDVLRKYVAESRDRGLLHGG